MNTLIVSARFDRGYIADPYWPEREKLINVQKQSGMNRARSEANRRKALEQWLKSSGLSLADYEKLEIAAARPFYTLDGTPQIVIPEHQVYGFLVATMDTIRAAGRACPPDQVRTRLLCDPWLTDREAPDGVYERFVTVTGGSGQKLSNQRALRSNPYIEAFTARGEIRYDPDFVTLKVLRDAIEWGGQNVGLGACRKMGWGRFVPEW